MRNYVAFTPRKVALRLAHSQLHLRSPVSLPLLTRLTLRPTLMVSLRSGAHSQKNSSRDRSPECLFLSTCRTISLNSQVTIPVHVYYADVIDQSATYLE